MKLVNTKLYTDIKRFRWIEALPDPVKPYVYLARLDRPIGAWLLLLPGLWSIVLAAGGVTAMNSHDWKLIFLFTIGAFVMRGAGCVINDLWDRKLDTKVERTQGRPLAAGEVTITGALAFLAALLTIGFMILMQTNITTVLLGVLVLPFIIIYPLMKRITWWPQAFLGITFNFGALMGWASVSGILELPALVLYAAGIFWTLGYDTIYAHQDKEDDALIGIKSLALKLGKDSKKWVAGFYAAALFLISVTLIMSGAGMLPIVLCLICGYHFFRQIESWNLSRPETALAAFKSNRDFGFLILAAMCFV